jgi:hypothetical protein
VEELILAKVLPEDKPLLGVHPVDLHVIDSQHLFVVFQTPLCNIFISLSCKETLFVARADLRARKDNRSGRILTFVAVRKSG